MYMSGHLIARSIIKLQSVSVSETVELYGVHNAFQVTYTTGDNQLFLIV
jgi:hypothetical protein